MPSATKKPLIASESVTINRTWYTQHTRAILDAPSLKDGNSKELRRLHDVAKQHLRALRVIKYETFTSLVTAILELELEHTTMFEWQWHTQDSNTVPDFDDLLEFLDLRAWAGKNAAWEGERRRQAPPLERKAVTRPSYTASVKEYCLACKKARHPLYGCKVFYDLPHAQKMNIVRNNGLCLNCLRPGHFINQCSSTQKCKRCQKPHHSLLHIDTRDKEAKVSVTESQRRWSWSCNNTHVPIK